MDLLTINVHNIFFFFCITPDGNGEIIRKVFCQIVGPYWHAMLCPTKIWTGIIDQEGSWTLL